MFEYICSPCTIEQESMWFNNLTQVVFDLTPYSIYTPFYAFANRIDPDQIDPVGAAWLGSILFANVEYGFKETIIYIWLCL